MLNDKRHIVTCDTANNVAVYDVLKVVRSEDLGAVSYDDEIRRRNQRIYIPNWFTVDLKIGMPTIVLGQDEVDCFAAWVSAETGLSDHVEAGSDVKINYGNLLLQALLEHWAHPALGPPSGNSQQQQTGGGSGGGGGGVDMGDQPQRGNEFFKVPKHTPVIISELAGRTVCRLLVRDTSGENESTFLTDNVPSWVTDVVVERTIPKFIKIPFYLQSHPQMAKQDRMKKDRLVANEFIQCRKVCEHVLEKVLGPEPVPAGGANAGGVAGTAGGTGGSSGGVSATGVGGGATGGLAANAVGSGVGAQAGGQGDGNSEASVGSLVPPEDKIELFCNDVVSAGDGTVLVVLLLSSLPFPTVRTGPRSEYGFAHGTPFHLEAIRRSDHSLQDPAELQLDIVRTAAVRSVAKLGHTNIHNSPPPSHNFRYRHKSMYILGELPSRHAMWECNGI